MMLRGVHEEKEKKTSLFAFMMLARHMIACGERDCDVRCRIMV